MRSYERTAGRRHRRDTADDLVGRLGRLAPAGLLARVRWLFLLFCLLAGSTTLIAISQFALAPTERTTALLAVGVWTVWLLHRHHHPGAGWATDVVGPLAVAALGWAVQDVALVNGVAYVSLFFQVLHGTRRQAVANGALYFASVHLTAVVASGPPPTAIQTTVNLISFGVVALVMHGLGDVAARHETATRRERVLTAVSARLLEARTAQHVHQVAADGTLELAGVSNGSATVWIGGEVLELAASAGEGWLGLDRGPRSATPSPLLSPFTEGRPSLLDADETRQIEDAYGLPHRFQELLVGPLLRDGVINGALLLASPHPLDAHLLDFMERFINEITLATERAELIAHLETANIELREAGAVKDQFVSTVSHELRTPLTAIHGFAQTLRQQGAVLTEEQRDRFLEIIERQSRHQQRLIEDLLTTSRMAAGRLVADPMDVDVATALATVLEDLRVSPAHTDLRGAGRARAFVDPAHLHQILVNLLTNAQKYGAAPYVIETAVASDTCTITVSDHGRGIPHDFREKLFEPFTQADSGDRRTAKGTGLGLAIVRNLVAANGGTITHRADRPGACFELVLPAADVPTPAPDPAGGTRVVDPDDLLLDRGATVVPQPEASAEPAGPPPCAVA